MKRILPFIVLLIASCGNEQKSTAEGLEKELETASAPATKGDNSCLLGYASRYNELLTLDEAATIAQQPAASAKEEYSKVLKNTSFHSITYQWKGEGMMQVGKYSVPRQNSIGITGIKPYTDHQFEQSYTAKTDEEIAALKQQVDKQTAGIVNGETSNKKTKERIEKLKKMGISEDQVKETAGSIAGSLMQSLKYFEPVVGVGDRASWNTMDNQLFVLKDGVLFQVSSNLSNDGARNKQAAIDAATTALKKCN